MAKNGKIGREEIIKILGRRCGLAPLEAQAVVDELFGRVGRGGRLLVPGLFQTAVAQGREVLIRGCLKIERRVWKGREVKHPGTGETVDAPDRHHPKFTASEAFKEYVEEQAKSHPDW